MNKERRKRIESIKEKLSDLQSDIDELKDEEQEAYDNLPESFQHGERGESISQAIDNLYYACSSIEEAIDYLNEAIE